MDETSLIDTIIQNWYNKLVSAFEVISNVNVRIQKHATNDAVYTTMFLKNCVMIHIALGQKEGNFGQSSTFNREETIALVINLHLFMSPY